jgi:oligoendopeptidase F
MQKRNEIAAKYKINTKDLFKNDEEFYTEINNIRKLIPLLSKYEGHILDTDLNLLKLLELDTEISKRVERVLLYAHLNNDFDLSDNKGNELVGTSYKLYNEYQDATSYIIPELLKSDYSVINKYLTNTNLKPYELTLKEIFRLKDHVLTTAEEGIISKLNPSFMVPEEASSKLLDTDLKFKKIRDEEHKLVSLTTSNYSKYIESKDRMVRKNAFTSFYHGYESVINTTATLLSSEIKNHNIMAKVRKYDTAMNEALITNNVNPEVYDTLLKAINNNLPIIHKQWDIRKKLLGVSELHIYDTYVPLVKNYDVNYSFEEARKLVENALQILGPDYSKKIKEAFDNNWIDVYPTVNKRSGGYCTCAYLAHPYVFLNYDNRYDEVSTIAHELGHAMHYYYAQTNNYYQDYSYTIFVAEVASQVNELLLSYYMLDHAKDKEEKLFILDELIKRFKAAVIRQSMFAEFEKNVHELEMQRTVLTKEVFNKEYYQLNQKYYGNKVKIDDQIKFEWSRIPHFYYDFYVYQYATGYISALKIAKAIYHHDSKALENYLAFLKLGSTKDPISSLTVAGVDLTSAATFNEAFADFAKVMTEFENLNKGSDLNG